MCILRNTCVSPPISLEHFIRGKHISGIDSTLRRSNSRGTWGDADMFRFGAFSSFTFSAFSGFIGLPSYLRRCLSASQRPPVFWRLSCSSPTTPFNENLRSSSATKSRQSADGLCFLLEVAFLVHASFLFILLLCLLVDLGGAFLAHKSNRERRNKRRSSCCEQLNLHHSVSLVSKRSEY